MRVRLARTAGFCMGVRRAMEIVLAEANKSQDPIYTYGPLIHNHQVLDLLKSKGVHAVQGTEGLTEGTIVIRAHGIAPDERRRLKTSGLRVINATCPRVARVHAIIRSHTRKGASAVIVGDPDHAEVIGLRGCAEGDVFVISGVAETRDLPSDRDLVVVAQTTQDEKVYRKICREITRRNPKARVFDTICDATHNRQAEVRSFKGLVDGVVVVGGYHSGNTRRLAKVSQDAGLVTFHVETERELDRRALSEMESIGVTAGASTPNWMIKAVVREIEGIQGRRDSRAAHIIKSVLKILLFSNVWVALGAFSLTHAAFVLMGRNTDLIHPAMAALYIWAMRILNRFLDKGASTYNEPDRAQFYKKNKNKLIISSIGAVAVALALAWQLGTAVLLAVAGVSLLGIIYSFPIVPVRRQQIWGMAKIKDIPGSKTFSESLAWGVVIALIPLLEPGPGPWVEAFVAFLFVMGVANVRTALIDIFQVQGDLIVGLETLPIIIGEKRTIKLIKVLLLGTAVLLAGAGLTGFVSPFAFLLLCVSLTFCLTVRAYERRWIYPGLRLEGMVEGNLIITGILGALWQAVSWAW